LWGVYMSWKELLKTWFNDELPMYDPVKEAKK